MQKKKRKKRNHQTNISNSRFKIYVDIELIETLNSILRKNKKNIKEEEIETINKAEVDKFRSETTQQRKKINRGK
jgi:hypothetical protein